jgi:dynein heavy chain, axonemal
MDTFCTTANGITPDPSPDSSKLVSMWFVFSLVWSVGGAVDEEGRRKIDSFLRENEAAAIQGSGTLYDYVVDKKGEWSSFAEQIPGIWKPASNTPLYKILVPTVDTVRFIHISQELMLANKQVLVVGDSGVGKSFIMQESVSRVSAAGMSVSSINFSAQTSSQRLQFIIEGRVEKRTKDVFGPPGGKKMVYVIDDLNMPAKDTFGSQPPLELLRHWLD